MGNGSGKSKEEIRAETEKEKARLEHDAALKKMKHEHDTSLKEFQDRQAQRAHDAEMAKQNAESERKTREYEATQKIKEVEIKERMAKLEISFKEQDQKSKISQKEKSINQVTAEIKNLDQLIEVDEKELENSKKELRETSEKIEGMNNLIRCFSNEKAVELKKLSDKIDLEAAKTKFEDDDRQIREAINKTGQHDSNVGRFLRLTHTLIGATVAAEANSNKLGAEIATFGEIISREASDTLSIDSYFHTKKLNRFIPILAAQDFCDMEDLVCGDKTEFEQDILKTLENGIKLQNIADSNANTNTKEETKNTNETQNENENEKEGAELAQELLRKWNLSKYFKALEEEGWDNPLDWKELTIEELMSDELGFKKGHANKFKRNHTKWSNSAVQEDNTLLSGKEQRVLKEICLTPESWRSDQAFIVKGTKAALCTIAPLMGTFFDRIHEAMKQSREILSYQASLNDHQRRAIQTIRTAPSIEELEPDEEMPSIEYPADQTATASANTSTNTNEDEDSKTENTVTEVTETTVATVPAPSTKLAVAKINDNGNGNDSAVDNPNDAMMWQCRALTKASVLSINVTKSMMDDFDQSDEPAVAARALGVAKGVEDCCVRIMQGQGKIRESVVLAQEILKLRPAYMSEAAQKLWKAVDDGIINIYDCALQMVKISSQYFGFFLRFRQSFHYYLSMNNTDENVPLMVSLQHLHKDVREFNHFQEKFNIKSQELSNQAMKCVRQCVSSAIGADHFDKVRASRENTRKAWLEKKKIYDKKGMELDIKLANYQKERISLCAEKAGMDCKVLILAKRIKNNTQSKLSCDKIKNDLQMDVY